MKGKNRKKTARKILLRDFSLRLYAFTRHSVTRCINNQWNTVDLSQFDASLPSGSSLVPSRYLRVAHFVEVKIECVQVTSSKPKSL